MELLEEILTKDNLNRAYKKVYQNKGASGVDGISVYEIKEYIQNNSDEILNQIRNRKYKPQPVRRVQIPKENGKKRNLGIPTVMDRIIQQAMVQVLSRIYEEQFSDNSYGFRANRSCEQAVIKALEYLNDGNDWIVDIDLEKFFDTVNQDRLITIIRRTIKDGDVVSLIMKYLKAGVMENGKVKTTKAGTPQGGVISPVLANLFLHYVFNDFMSKEFPNIPWVRYADDGALNCVSIKQAKYIIKVLDKRFKAFGLELNLSKTRIVYCKDDDRNGNYENTSFDFLGYTFKPRSAKNKHGKMFRSFLPAMSDKAQKAIRKEIKSWKLQLKVDKTINDIAEIYNSKIQGWINYYAHYYKSEIYGVLKYINRCLIKWVRRKYKKKNTRKRAIDLLMKIARRDNCLFAHWKFGILPTAG